MSGAMGRSEGPSNTCQVPPELGRPFTEVVLGPVASSVTPRQRHRSAVLGREGGRGQPDAHRGGRGFHSGNCGKR